MEGTVKWFSAQKGYGFIKGDDGEEYFVHHKALAEGTELNENDHVTFDAVETERGKQAQNVVKGAAPAEEAEAPEESSEE